MWGTTCQSSSRGATPWEAVDQALADLGATDPATTRWVWVKSPDIIPDLRVAINFGANRGVTLTDVVMVGEQLARVDFLRLADNENDVRDLLDAWELLVNDEPYFLSNDVVTEETKVKVPVEPYTARDGEEYDFRWERTTKTLRPFGPHVNEQAVELQAQTGSAVPIVEARFLIHHLLANEGGGLYYEFQGIKESNNEKQDDLTFFLASYGLDLSVVELLRSDQKWATLRSGITGRPRAVLIVPHLRSRPTVNQGNVYITLDSFYGDKAAELHPILNLVESRYRAIELIAEEPSGLLRFALFGGNADENGDLLAANEQHKLQRSAPRFVVTDTTVPPPHPAILEPAISCIRCHAAGEGWRELDDTYSVTRLLRSRVDVFGDQDDGFPDFETINRVAGLYTGDFDKLLDRAREDLGGSMAMLHPKPILLGDGTPVPVESGSILDGDATSQSWDSLGQTHREYWYAMVDTPEIAADMGYVAKDDLEARGFLISNLRPLPPDQFGIRPEDPRIAAILDGTPINRLDYEAVFLDVAHRIRYNVGLGKVSTEEVANPPQ